MKIYVIRHGETELNVKRIKQGWLDASLNQAGRDLARLTGQALQGIHFDACFSSPLKRAWETVEILLRESGNENVPIQADDRLKEINFGEEEGTPGTYSSLPPETAQLFFSDALRFPGFPGGESIRDVCRRTGDFLNELIRQDRYGTVLVGTHGCALRAMMNPLYAQPDRFWQGHVPANCAITILESAGGQARILESDKIYYDPSLAVDHFKSMMRN
ncbi:MAG: histidine phosphatase family protein [Clostridia bacterium]|nr:histidine phosphatase family protein [Clostridia bacterium]